LSPAAAAVVATAPVSFEATLTVEPTSTEEPAGAVFWISPTAPQCVNVMAVEALHLRQAPTEHSRTVIFLAGGEVVRLVSDRDPDWWLVSRAGVIGYARSAYLEIVRCEND
jgi:hypothetical protein